ncbi:MAG: ComEC/Rec2 family competence protein [bacterium]|nr:ComEC/Rec2 family competence protein [bacterium]
MTSISSSGAFLYVGAVGVCAGIALALLFTVELVAVAFLLGVAVICLCTYAVQPNKKFFIAAIFLCATVFGIARTDFYFKNQASNGLSFYAGKQATVLGTVTNDPERRETSLHVHIFVQEISGELLPANRRGTVLAILNREEKVSYGDTIEVSGSLAVPQAFETDTGHIFDYTGYLQVQGVSVLMQRAQLISGKKGSLSLQGSLFTLKHAFEQSVEKLFPEPDNALLEGILLGERRGMPKDLNDAFVASGLVHVVVLSGYNISIVAVGVFELLRFLGLRGSFSVGGVVMILFALMTGAGATTMRALLMALIALLARYLGRSTLALRSLAVAGTAMALWNPFGLLHDPSFILSMLATFGLITLSPWVEVHLPNFLLRFPTIRGIIGSTVAVQIFVLPALLYFTGILSFLAVPANALALPVVPFAMLGGFIAGLLGLLHPTLAFAPTIFTDILLKWMILVAQTTQSVPLATMIIPAFSAWVVVIIYMPLTFFAISKHSLYSSATLQQSQTAALSPTN